MKKAAENPRAQSQHGQSLQFSRKLLGWEAASEEARDWWRELEQLNDDRTSLIIKLAGELLTRQATIEDFFTACLYSGREGVQDNLNFLDLIHQDKVETCESETPLPTEEELSVTYH